MWRAVRAQRFECYCRQSETDTGVDWKPVQMLKQCSSWPYRKRGVLRHSYPSRRKFAKLNLPSGITLQHGTKHQLLRLLQFRLTRDTTVFLPVHSFACSSISRTVNRTLCKLKNWFWRKLAQVVRGGKRRSVCQRSRQHGTEIGHENPFKRDTSRTIWQILTKPGRHILKQMPTMSQ